VLFGGCGSTAIPRAALDHDRAGVMHLAAGRLDEAEARFRLALEHRPDFAEAHANLGLVALARGDTAEAMQHLERALDLDPELSAAWADLGVARERAGDADRAREAYEQALAIEPGLRSARRNLAFLLARGSAFREARAHLLRLVELDPEDGEARGVLAWCELRLGRPVVAEERADAALAIDPDAASARLVRGAARAARGDLDAAIEDLAIAEERSVLGREARVRLAAALALRADDVRQDLSRADLLVTSLLRDDEHDPAARLVAATLSLAREDTASAARHARAVLHLRPDLGEARALLDRVCALDEQACR
jgi:tetratricopeptide (TPR) repeat protein